jgi:DMSO/TMAO reductase YedYZ molybdopterin-dependent catalytic subunit
MFSHEDPKYQQGEPATPDQVAPGVVISPDTQRGNRIPPGQSRTRKWPVLDAFGPPLADLSNWQLKIFGLVNNPVSFTLAEFQKLPRVKVFSDFHCVTKWSRLGNLWEGVSTRHLLSLAGVQSAAKFVVCHAYDNSWTTNLPLADFMQDDCLLADLHDGEPITLEHGGPVRGMVPQLYAWKSAKWIRGIELVENDRAGYWEAGGYHMHGDPWTEERFRSDQIPSGYSDDGGAFQ